jgi:DNA-binding NtrC family response regulator
LERSVKDGLFRADLYYRLNVVAINLPPLRERREDIAALAQYFLRKHSMAIRGNITGISEEARKKLEAYDWPGNVRELANVIERAVVLGSGPTVTLEDLPGRIAAGWTTPAPEVQSYREGLDAARKELILKALATTHGNRSAAAKLLGLEAKYFLKLMKSLGIE